MKSYQTLDIRIFSISNWLAGCLPSTVSPLQIQECFLVVLFFWLGKKSCLSQNSEILEGDYPQVWGRCDPLKWLAMVVKVTGQMFPIFDLMSQKTESVKLQKIRELYCFGVVQVHAYRSCSVQYEMHSWYQMQCEVQYEFCLGPNKTYLPGWCMYSHTLGYPTRPSSSH